MLYQPHFLYRLKLIVIYLIVKLEFLHPLLPKKFRDELPRGCNNQMFWTAFKSGGTKLYFEYACKLSEPESYEPKVVVDSAQVKVLPAKAGQFYLFCERTIHGSTDNTTDEKRWAIGGRIMKADTKVFTKNMLENGLNLEVYGVRKIKLDRWKPVLVRGKEQR